MSRHLPEALVGRELCDGLHGVVRGLDVELEQRGEACWQAFTHMGLMIELLEQRGEACWQTFTLEQRLTWG